MCTISIVPHGGGVRVVCNRDERRDRSAALAPAEHRAGAGRALFPRDPVGGGTWIGVNCAGFVAALLNRHPGPGETRRNRPPAAEHLTSRGIIVPELLQFARTGDALAQLDRLSTAAFAAFRAVLVDGRSIWTAAGGGGLRLQIDRHRLNRPHVFSSSALGDAVVEEPRRRLFQRLLASRPEAPVEAQTAFHRHQWPTAPAISVLMSRVDARTVSRTEVDLPVAGPIVMRYEPLAGIPERSYVC